MINNSVTQRIWARFGERDGAPTYRLDFAAAG
jgi:hypothetical protein